MRTTIFLVVLFFGTSIFSQNSEYAFIWKTIKNNDNLPKREAIWLKDNLSHTELTKAIDLVANLSRPAASQMLVSYFYLNGSYKWKSVKPYLDSLRVRPLDREVGIIWVAYLASKLRNKRIEIKKSSKFYVAQFSETSFELPKYQEKDINKNIALSFDYELAQIILDILSRSDVSYQEILDKLNLQGNVIISLSKNLS